MRDKMYYWLKLLATGIFAAEAFLASLVGAWWLLIGFDRLSTEMGVARTHHEWGLLTIQAFLLLSLIGICVGLCWLCGLYLKHLYILDEKNDRGEKILGKLIRVILCLSLSIIIGLQIANECGAYYNALMHGVASEIIYETAYMIIAFWIIGLCPLLMGPPYKVSLGFKDTHAH